MLLTLTEKAKATLAQKAAQNAALWSDASMGRSIDLSVFHSRSVLYCTFVWAHQALNRPRRFPVRAGQAEHDGRLQRDGDRD